MELKEGFARSNSDGSFENTLWCDDFTHTYWFAFDTMTQPDAMWKVSKHKPVVVYTHKHIYINFVLLFNI